MKILYFASLESKTEGRKNTYYVKRAFEKLGHEVINVNDDNFVDDDLLKIVNDKKPDLFLFHKGGCTFETTEELRDRMERLKYLLSKIPCKKVFWYFDKVYQGREYYIHEMLQYVDAGFSTDGTFIRRHKYPNLFLLRQGASKDAKLGDYDEIYDCDIALIGSIYGARTSLTTMLSRKYGDRFRVYSNVFGKDFANLCESAKIILSPMYPMDNFYWSDRVYKVLSHRGLLFHPKFHGLEEEDGLISGKHYIGYKTYPDLVNKIDSMLEEDDLTRLKIAQEGRDHVLHNCTLEERCQQILTI